MSKFIYYVVIVIGLILFVLGVIPNHFSVIWGIILLAGGGAGLYSRRQSQKRVEARLDEEKDKFRTKEGSEEEK